jgi:hypothetical protein
MTTSGTFASLDRRGYLRFSLAQLLSFLTSQTQTTPVHHLSRLRRASTVERLARRRFAASRAAHLANLPAALSSTADALGCAGERGADEHVELSCMTRSSTTQIVPRAVHEHAAAQRSAAQLDSTWADCIESRFRRMLSVSDPVYSEVTRARAAFGAKHLCNFVHVCGQAQTSRVIYK